MSDRNFIEKIVSRLKTKQVYLMFDEDGIGVGPPFTIIDQDICYEVISRALEEEYDRGFENGVDAGKDWERNKGPEY